MAGILGVAPSCMVFTVKIWYVNRNGHLDSDVLSVILATWVYPACRLTYVHSLCVTCVSCSVCSAFEVKNEMLNNSTV